jgi:hypothetical protein
MRPGLFRSLDRRNIEREIEDELRFHLELLIEENLRQGMAPEKAEAQALKRFGNIERIKNQCVEISSRSRPMVRVLRSFLVVIFLAGVTSRIASTDLYVNQIGNMLMTIAVLGGLLVYLRGLRFSGFVPEVENSTPLGLMDRERVNVEANDGSENTPLERMINDH